MMPLLSECTLEIYDEFEDEDITVNVFYYYTKGIPATRNDPPEFPEVEIMDIEYEGESIMSRFSWQEIKHWQGIILEDYVAKD
jgi:hypothetical protein